MTRRHEGTVAIVTGAGRGIGRAIVTQLAAEGAAVAVVEIDEAAGQEAAAELTASGTRAIALRADIAKFEEIEAAVAETTRALGTPTLLVNNAAFTEAPDYEAMRLESWRREIEINLNGTYHCVRAVIPTMKANGGGAIVNIASISGLRASTLRVAYGTSKAALSHLTKQQAAELGNLGIRVNAVAPGPVDTAMAKQVHTPDIRAGYHDAIPLNRYGTEQEIAAAVCFLCSDAASYVNGQTLAVDGGFDASGIGLPALRNER
jgi:meso-butanediol dehydrogenase/(S,S)-butanediol dehydrogenase/diacetyl reductase